MPHGFWDELSGGASKFSCIQKPFGEAVLGQGTLVVNFDVFKGVHLDAKKPRNRYVRSFGVFQHILIEDEKIVAKCIRITR